mmetsp:Transcript_21546/g.35229  ORF Transcript_21546/g.35229 Transcript_21546/m.35229 type:complete len:104 (-) Transcript_21546:337-648(-)
MKRFRDKKNYSNSQIIQYLVDTWQQDDKQQLPALYKEKGIDYVRLHCNFGDSYSSIGGAAQLTPRNLPQFRKLARAAKECQVNEINGTSDIATAALARNECHQ